MNFCIKRLLLLIGFCLQISLGVANEMPLKNKDAVNRFLPQQLLKSVDFRRGLKGEGLILLGLSAQNTVVDSQQTNGGMSLNLLNTKLLDSLSNHFEVSDFATPVKSFVVVQQGQNVSINIALNTENYEYSSDQTNRLLTIAFRPINAAEKELQQRDNKVYRGNKLSLNFQDIEVRSVLEILADFTELNIVAADSV
ncbi:MAG: AMIN domain-containing protein, partial [Methylomonas sp.]